MKVLSIQYTEKSESLLFVHVQDENGKDLIVLPFYHKPDDIKTDSRLKNSIEQLPQLLQLLYNSGKNNEEIIFEEKKLDI